jgi:hypothetical protein
VFCQLKRLAARKIGKEWLLLLKIPMNQWYLLLSSSEGWDYQYLLLFEALWIITL